jgi:uncharacterized protein YjbI with pentapeptide repeats
MANEYEGSRPDQKQPESERKFSQQQYDLLKRCSEKKNMSEWNEWRKEHPDDEIRLQGVDLRQTHLENVKLSAAHLENAKLSEAHLENAKLLFAHLENAELRFAHLENANLSQAHLEKANLEYAHLENAFLLATHLENASLMDSYPRAATFLFTKLQGADFSRAIVDGETLFSEDCEVNRNTKFEAVALGNLRIYPNIRQLLEYNIRRMNWKEWYKEHWLLQWPVKFFWSFSDYGKSTWRIIGWFFLLSLAFAAIYANCACWWPPGIVNNLDVEPHLPLWHYFILVLLRPVYFSIVTMTTLGFGDMHANETSIWGHALLTVQVILGYVLLGALVTRFAVLFTAGGPAGKFTPIKIQEKGDDKNNKVTD